jgi:hypothetical protein
LKGFCEFLLDLFGFGSHDPVAEHGQLSNDADI